MGMMDEEEGRWRDLHVHHQRKIQLNNSHIMVL